MRDRRSGGLRQAASTVFVLTAVLPLLIFTWTLFRLSAIQSFDAQVGLILALLVALLGYAVFRSLMAQLSEMIGALRTVATKRDGVREKSSGSALESAGAPLAAVSAAAQKGKAAAPKRRGNAIAGLGQIRELRDIDGTMAAVWQNEASAYVGRAVLVSVLNSSRPIAGTLLRVTADGVLVDQGGEEVAIGYRRFAGIELDSA